MRSSLIYPDVWKCGSKYPDRGKYASTTEHMGMNATQFLVEYVWWIRNHISIQCFVRCETSFHSKAAKKHIWQLIHWDLIERLQRGQSLMNPLQWVYPSIWLYSQVILIIIIIIIIIMIIMIIICGSLAPNFMSSAVPTNLHEEFAGSIRFQQNSQH